MTKTTNTTKAVALAFALATMALATAAAYETAPNLFFGGLPDGAEVTGMVIRAYDGNGQHFRVFHTGEGIFDGLRGVTVDSCIANGLDLFTIRVSIDGKWFRTRTDVPIDFDMGTPILQMTATEKPQENIVPELIYGGLQFAAASALLSVPKEDYRKLLKLLKQKCPKQYAYLAAKAQQIKTYVAAKYPRLYAYLAKKITGQEVVKHPKAYTYLATKAKQATACVAKAYPKVYAAGKYVATKVCAAGKYIATKTGLLKLAGKLAAIPKVGWAAAGGLAAFVGIRLLINRLAPPRPPAEGKLDIEVNYAY